jgi:phosphoglycolate phosphatase
MVHAFCGACGLSPNEVAVIGDNLHDMEMGRDAGAGLVIGVLSGNSRREDFGTIADAVLESVADLPRYLDGR